MKDYRAIKIAALLDELKKMRERPTEVLRQDIKRQPAGKPNPKVPGASIGRTV